MKSKFVADTLPARLFENRFYGLPLARWPDLQLPCSLRLFKFETEHCVAAPSSFRRHDRGQSDRFTNKAATQRIAGHG